VGCTLEAILNILQESPTGTDPAGLIRFPS
jgi:hypothetical protein